MGVIHFGGGRLSCEALPRGESRFRRVVPAPMGGDNGFLLGPISAYWLQTQTQCRLHQLLTQPKVSKASMRSNLIHINTSEACQLQSLPAHPYMGHH